MDIIKVRCKYFDISKRICNDNIVSKNGRGSECMANFGDVRCDLPFNIDWVRFILYREHLIEVKE
jgi:hypothetical protein